MYRQSPKTSMAGYLGVSDPRNIRWSDTLHAIHNAVPDVSITV
jgi:hypothetical protein